MKFIANHLVAIHNVATAEAMVLAMKAGLDPHQTVEVIGSGAGTSRVFELRAPMMADNTYLPATMRSSTWKKDLTRDRRLRRRRSAARRRCSRSRPRCMMAVLATGHGAEDTAAVCATLERMAGVVR